MKQELRERIIGRLSSHHGFSRCLEADADIAEMLGYEVVRQATGRGISWRYKVGARWQALPEYTSDLDVARKYLSRDFERNNQFGFVCLRPVDSTSWIAWSAVGGVTGSNAASAFVLFCLTHLWDKEETPTGPGRRKAYADDY